ncbi:MAG: hypothetical protein MUF15_27595 [Acidobacteria bacterium]|nr:hypothetical protein [Acidobacteriota bacterium]
MKSKTRRNFSSFFVPGIRGPGKLNPRYPPPREVFAFLPGIRYNTNTLDNKPIG